MPLGSDRHQLANCPYKSSQLPRDRSQGARSAESPREMSIAKVQSLLGSPGEVNERKRNAGLSLLERALNAWAMARMMGRFTQDMAKESVAGLGNPSAVHRLAAGVFTRNQPGVRHELSGFLEAPKVTGFGHDGDRTEKGDAAKALERCNERKMSILFGGMAELALQTTHPKSGLVEGGEVILKDRLLLPGSKHELFQPRLVLARATLGSGWWRETFTEQKFHQSMPCPQQVDLGVRPGAYQISQRLMRLVGDPDGSQITATQEPRKQLGITSIGFDSITGAPRHQ